MVALPVALPHPDFGCCRHRDGSGSPPKERRVSSPGGGGGVQQWPQHGVTAMFERYRRRGEGAATRWFRVAPTGEWVPEFDSGRVLRVFRNGSFRCSMQLCARVAGASGQVCAALARWCVWVCVCGRWSWTPNVVQHLREAKNVYFTAYAIDSRRTYSFLTRPNQLVCTVK